MDRHRELATYVGEAADAQAFRLPEFFEQLVERVGVGVGAIGAHGKFVYVNDRYAEMVGWSQDALIGREVGEVNPEFDQSQFDEYWNSYSPEETRIYETVHRTAGGEEFPVQARITRLEIANQEFNVGTVQDITELEKRREQLDVLRRVLRHDLRNRLNVVAGYVDLIEIHLDETDQLRTHFEQIQAEIEHLLATSENSRRLEELLDMTAAQSGAQPAPIRLDSLLKDAVSKTRSKFSSVDINYTDPGPVEVRAADYLGQTITHVLSNAVIHNDNDRPRVDVDAGCREDTVLVSIADNGPGIPRERRDLVFGREERDQLHHGRGFGLFFVKNVVEESGGDIWIEDNEPRGAVFKIELPLES